MNAIPTTRPVDVLSALIERERCDGTVGVPALDRAEAWLAERAQLDADAPSPLVAQLQQQLDTLRGHIREIAARADRRRDPQGERAATWADVWGGAVTTELTYTTRIVSSLDGRPVESHHMTTDTDGVSRDVGAELESIYDRLGAQVRVEFTITPRIRRKGER